MNDTAANWTTAIATSAAAAAAVAAAITAFLQWKATRAQTKAALFSERYEAFKAFKERIVSANLHEGSFGDVQEAQRAAHKLKFLFPLSVTNPVEELLQLAWKVVEERQMSMDHEGKHSGGPHYSAMAEAAKEVRTRVDSLDEIFAPALDQAKSI